ncbi:ribulose-phosphate 3-epimerase [Candidatus Tachikawaea gelatinosa]|uniref:Ribulose-phosphate 3-epimerase n=1 Tax=Candidatus Tachikawaea gelatinosa TaxID=1410383 RepID=A0A090BWG6_9ENTR|nr:ribulose-phosphate 3-epimerase [Candidatus Tachikawaea gelatinosa]BAP58571.1 ribulose-phosphate 3-epimerase [Candidatus Tachikawaea gelatinosa]
MKKYLLAPSILSANFACLGKDVKNVLEAGSDMIHFDVMDGHYVPNLTFGPIVLKSLRNYGINAPIDVHLMIKPVEYLIQQFSLAGADFITFHPECEYDIDRTINLIKLYGCKVGLAFNPATPLFYLDYVLDKLDMILIMSVNPGYSGQKFIYNTIEKLYQVREKINKSNFDIPLSIDGGINIKNIADVAKTGVDIFVIGSTIFNSLNYKKTIHAIKHAISHV